MDAVTHVPQPANEPVRQYVPGSPERAAVENKIKELAGERAELTMTIGGQQRTGSRRSPSTSSRRTTTGTCSGPCATRPARTWRTRSRRHAAAAPLWRDLSFDDRAAILLKAADLLSGPWRSTINAATILGQSKSVYQAEIDAACELIDFWRYNVHFARRLLEEQPQSSPGTWNRMEYRPLEGFVLAITPVQLHLDRREPADRAGPARQRRGVEAVADAAARRALHAAPARGGRAAAGRDQPGHRGRAGGVPGGAAAPRPGGHPLHRVHGDVPAPVADGRREHRRLPRLPACGRRDRRQGLRRRPPVAPTPRSWPRRWSGARTSTRGRSVPPPRARTCPARCGTACATTSWPRWSR